MSRVILDWNHAAVAVGPWPLAEGRLQVIDNDVNAHRTIQEEESMNRQLKAAVLTLVIALLFVGLQLAVGVQTGLAGVFVLGLSGGLLIGDLMARASSRTV